MEGQARASFATAAEAARLAAARDARLAWDRAVSERRAAWAEEQRAKAGGAAAATQARLDADAARSAERRAELAVTSAVPRAVGEEEAAAAAYRAERRVRRADYLRTREAALATARDARRNNLLAASSGWVTPEQLDQRIEAALASPTPLF